MWANEWRLECPDLVRATKRRRLAVEVVGDEVGPDTVNAMETRHEVEQKKKQVIKCTHSC